MSSFVEAVVAEAPFAFVADGAFPEAGVGVLEAVVAEQAGLEALGRVFAREGPFVDVVAGRWNEGVAGTEVAVAFEVVRRRTLGILALVSTPCGVSES